MGERSAQIGPIWVSVTPLEGSAAAMDSLGVAANPATIISVGITPTADFHDALEEPPDEEDAEGFFDASEAQATFWEGENEDDDRDGYDAEIEAERERTFVAEASRRVAASEAAPGEGAASAPQIFPSKGFIDKLRPQQVRAECEARGLPTDGGKAAGVKRLKAWQDLNRPPRTTAAAAAREVEAEKWADVSSVADHKVPEYMEVGGVIPDCGLDSSSTPRECFHKFVPESEASKWADYSNAYGAKNEFGSKTYKRGWQPWTPYSVWCFVSTYIVHGLDPRPSILDFFSVSWAYPDNNVRRMWGDVKRFQAAKASFQVSNPDETCDGYFTDILYKVREFLTVLRNGCESMWILFREVSIDEMDIGFQGRMAALKERIKFKREGDGFLPRRFRDCQGEQFEISGDGDKTRYESTSSRCQFCRWKKGKTPRARFYCSQCKIQVCSNQCYAELHNRKE